MTSLFVQNIVTSGETKSTGIQSIIIIRPCYCIIKSIIVKKLTNDDAYGLKRCSVKLIICQSSKKDQVSSERNQIHEENDGGMESRSTDEDYEPHQADDKCERKPPQKASDYEIVHCGKRH